MPPRGAGCPTETRGSPARSRRRRNRGASRARGNQRGGCRARGRAPPWRRRAPPRGAHGRCSRTAKATGRPTTACGRRRGTRAGARARRRGGAPARRARGTRLRRRGRASAGRACGRARGPSPAPVRGAGALAAGAAAQAESVLRDEAVDGVGQRVEPGHGVEPGERPQERAQPEQVGDGGGAGEHPTVRQHELHRFLARCGAHLGVAGERTRARRRRRPNVAAVRPALRRSDSRRRRAGRDAPRVPPCRPSPFMADSPSAAKSRGRGCDATARGIADLPEMADAPRLVTDPAELAALVGDIRASGRLALDTEFVWERTYRPQLGIVQIATDRKTAILDALALRDLSPLFPLLRDPAIPVVLHGGGQDLEILALLMGEPVRGVVDTQVIAAFLGYGLQVGLGVLLERVLRVRVRKDQTYTDWTRRPLRPEQLAYAREDVVHLLPLHDRLRAALEQRGRAAWVAEELQALEDPARWRPVPDEERYRSVKGWQRLGGRELAVLRALAAWRERTARQLDVRPHFVVSDVVLTTLAARPVASLEELRGVRGLSPGAVSRYGRGLLAAIGEGRACPPAR